MRRAAAVVVVCLMWTVSAEAGRIRIVKLRPAKKVTARKQAVRKVVPPGPVDANSLGFGSTWKDVTRLLGKPTRVQKVQSREIWFYDHSTITLGKGRVIAWCVYDRPLPMNIGAAKPGAPPAKPGMTMAQLIAARGTPNTVVVQGNLYLWFYGTTQYVLREGKVAPSDVVTQMQTASSKAEPAKRTSPSRNAAKQAGCWCPL